MIAVGPAPAFLARVVSILAPFFEDYAMPARCQPPLRCQPQAFRGLLKNLLVAPPRPVVWLAASLVSCPVRSTMACLVACSVTLAGGLARGELHAGAAVVDITPQQFPVFINGGFTARKGEPRDVKARAIVLDDGRTKLALVVADSCILPKDLIDASKALAAERTGIPTDHIMISATHTHTAPSAISALGTPADDTYVPYLRLRLADAIAEAAKNLQPARVGFGSVDAAEFTALRRWILRPDLLRTDPFGDATVRATMHAAKDNLLGVTGESGPEDPELAVLSLQSPEGEPIAMLANFSMHYYGSGPAADYFGSFCDALEAHFAQAASAPGPVPVAVMSHGCSGDIWRVDYRTGEQQDYDPFVAGMVSRAVAAIEAIGEHQDADLAMAEARLAMNYRVPDAARLAWATQRAEQLGDALPTTQEDVYAIEQIELAERGGTEVVVQGIRIGDVAIATTPTETYALTGLKIKRQSPLAHTFVIELANGGDGYIPPPEQHALGGYNTWAARSAGLEVTAEPRIVAAALSLLERVCGSERRACHPPASPMADRLRRLDPVAYYPLDEMEGPIARDAGGGARDATIEGNVAFYLAGPSGEAFADGSTVNRSLQFVGGRLATRADDIANDLTLSLWAFNGLGGESREMQGWLASCDHPHGLSAKGLHLGLESTGPETGRLVLDLGHTRHRGTTTLHRWQWHHVTFVRQGDEWRLYVDGKLDASGTGAAGYGCGEQVYVGGRSDNTDGWEGRLDEVAIFSRGLDPATIKVLAARPRGE
jgi:hypothetical protein